MERSPIRGTCADGCDSTVRGTIRRPRVRVTRSPTAWCRMMISFLHPAGSGETPGQSDCGPRGSLLICCSLTGARWAPPGPRALPCGLSGVDERACAQRHVALPALAWTPARAPVPRANVPAGARGLPRPRPCASRAPTEVPPHVCGGRYEGTEPFLGRRAPAPSSLSPPSRWRSPRKTCVGPSRWCPSRRQGRRHTLPEADDAWLEAPRKKSGNIRS